MSIANQIERLRLSLPSGVSLLAVSKFHPAEAIMEAYDAGQRAFGESRVQELQLKYEALPKDIEWHMIGHLQTNKVKYIAPFISLIESLDSERLALEVQRQADRCNRVIDCLLEIHITDEESKSGWAWDDLLGFVRGGGFKALPNIRIRGVMGMATLTDEESVVRRDFERLAACKVELEEYFGDEFDTLSMGMSDDYPIAVEYGSTQVRVGSTIFGAREY
ncbi:MAG: YggS family pyridoxal phosphate-dependent enzyme [Rikenellaceae bacterium]|nr:YggS family pyridoxal phosphate-dependent enzyme [Rikenellaceae bacterium]